MIHIIAQPKINYYTWQVEVVINSILEHMPNNEIHIVCSNVNGEIKENHWHILESRYKKVKFFYYDDTRINPSYISSIRPHILEKHFMEHTSLENETIFYHDSDIIFTKPVEIEENNDNWYVSDTISYIGYDYIVSKGEDVLKLMCDIVDIDPNIIRDNQKNSGGAQYIMKNVNHSFWNDVYMDCENLYIEVNKLSAEKKTNDPNYHELQIWCADMWAVLWNAWKREYSTICDERLNFTWTTTNINYWNNSSIYHNAGITSSDKNVFFKNLYSNTLPYNINLPDLDQTKCVYNYYNYVQEIGEKSFIHNTISIVIICTNLYSLLGIRFVDNFIKHYKGDKKIIFNLFSDIDVLSYIKEYDDTKFHMVMEYYTNIDWVDGANSKFSNILSMDCYGEHIYYFDADTNIIEDFTEEWFHGDLVGGEHFINQSSVVKNYDRNPLSRAYISEHTPNPQTYFYGAFFGGSSKKMLEMCKVIYDNQLTDKLINYEPCVNDESYTNHYFHYNVPMIIPCENFKFIVSDKGGIENSRHSRDISTELLKIKECKSQWSLKEGKVHYL